jgi:hypothetical protein
MAAAAPASPPTKQAPASAAAPGRASVPPCARPTCNHHIPLAGRLLPPQHVDCRLADHGDPNRHRDFGSPIHYSCPLHDDLSLRVHYVAADVFVILFRQDNLSNTGLEVHACGTPVVAFATCGLIVIVDHHTTGAPAEPFDPLSLVARIRWMLVDLQLL